MTFACVWIPDWPIGVASTAAPPPSRLVEALTPALLAVVPRVTIESRGIVWADVRGLPVRETAVAIRKAVQVVVADGAVHVGVASVPVTARVAALYGTSQHDTTAVFPSTVTVVQPGSERTFLARHPIAILEPSRRLEAYFAGVGIERCGELARLAMSEVELRFGAEGVKLWQWARANNARMIFSTQERERPHASVEWTDYAMAQVAQVLFPVNALLQRVLDELKARGMGTRKMVLRFSLADGSRVEHAIGAARVTADPDRWGKLVRYALETLQLPDAITGVALWAELMGVSSSLQGDVFDRGFGSASDAERSLGRLEDLGAVPTLVMSGVHPLPEQRVTETRDLANERTRGRGVCGLTAVGQRNATHAGDSHPGRAGTDHRVHRTSARPLGAQTISRGVSHGRASRHPHAKS